MGSLSMKLFLLVLVLCLGPITSQRTCNRLAYLRTFFGHSESARTGLKRVWEISKQLKHLDPCQADIKAIKMALEQSKDSIDKHIWAGWAAGLSHLGDALVNEMVVKISLVGYVFGGLPSYYGLW